MQKVESDVPVLKAKADKSALALKSAVWQLTGFTGYRYGGLLLFHPEPVYNSGDGVLHYS